MFNRMKAVVTFAAGAVAGLMLAACLTVQGSRPGVFGGEALILPLMALLLYVGYEAGRLSTLAQAEQRRRRRRASYSTDARMRRVEGDMPRISPSKRLSLSRLSP